MQFKPVLSKSQLKIHMKEDLFQKLAHTFMEAEKPPKVLSTAGELGKLVI